MLFSPVVADPSPNDFCVVLTFILVFNGGFREEWKVYLPAPTVSKPPVTEGS